MASQMLPDDPADVLQLLQERIQSLASRHGQFIHAWVHSYTDLLVDFSPTTGESIERYGKRTVAFVKTWRNDGCGYASGKVIGMHDLEKLLSAALSAPYGSPVEARPTLAPVVSRLKGKKGTISGERARQRAAAFLRGFTRNEGARLQTLLMRQQDGTLVITNSAGLSIIEPVCAEELLLRCETRLGALVDGYGQPVLDGAWEIDALQQRLQEEIITVEAEKKAPDPDLPVVLRPVVAAPLAAGLAWLLRGDTALRTPKLAAAVGHKIFPALLTVRDDPHDPLGTRSRSYDDEGQPSLPLTLIQDGRPLCFLHSSQSAHELAHLANGRSFTDPANAALAPQALNLSICPGESEFPAKYLEFTTKIEVLKSMPRAGLVTITGAGWEVHAGVRQHGIHPIDLHLPLIPTFRRLIGIGNDLHFFPGAEGCGAPSLLFQPLLAGEGL